MTSKDPYFSAPPHRLPPDEKVSREYQIGKLKELLARMRNEHERSKAIGEENLARLQVIIDRLKEN